MRSRVLPYPKPERAVLMQLAYALGDRNPWFCNKENVPLAAGYLRSMARSRGLLDACDIEILSPSLSDVAGDAAVTDAVVGRAPQVLGLSLYPWNYDRALAIAAAARAELPELAVVAGGPEVNTATLPALLGERAIDIACVGEGEVTFAVLIEALIDGRDLREVEGIAFIRDGAIVTTPRRKTLVDLDDIPSPFIEGDIDARHYRQVHVLFERGCPYSCKFCHWWPDKRSKGRFSLARIEAELDSLRDAGVEEVIFLDASLNSSPRFDDLCDVVANVNADRKLQIKVQVLFDRLTRDQCERLARCGVRKLELGLQSASRETLRMNQRPTDLKLFQHAMDITSDLGMALQIDFIMGLPGDSIADAEDTARFIRQMSSGRGVGQISPFVLSVGSATRMRQEAEKLRLRFQPAPPYRVLSSGDLDYDDLRSLRMRIPELLGFPEHPFFAFDRPHYQVNLFEPELATFLSPMLHAPVESRESTPFDSAVTIDAIHIHCHDDRAGHRHAFDGSAWTRRLSQVAQVRLELDHPQLCVDHVRGALTAMSRANPHTVWDIVLETRAAFDLDSLAEMLAAVERVPHNLDWDNYFASPSEGDGRAPIALRPFVIVPLHGIDPEWAVAAATSYPLIHALTVDDERSMKRDLQTLVDRPGEGVLVDFVEGADPMLVPRVVSQLLGVTRYRVRGFRNLAVSALLQQENARRRGQPRPRVPHRDRTVIDVDDDGSIAVHRFTRRQVMLETTQLCLSLRPGVGLTQRVAAT